MFLHLGLSCKSRVFNCHNLYTRHQELLQRVLVIAILSVRPSVSLSVTRMDQSIKDSAI